MDELPLPPPASEIFGSLTFTGEVLRQHLPEDVYRKLEMTMGYQHSKNWSFEFTYTNYPYGESIAAGDQYSVALVYYFSKD